VRRADKGDLPRLLKMGRNFAAAANLSEAIGYDPDSTAAMFCQLMDSGILLIGRGGAIGGAVFPSPFNNAHVIAQEFFWWVEPEHRGQGSELLAAFEEAAREMGAHSVMVSTMEVLNHDAAAKFYARRGYNPADRNFIKGIA